VDIAAAHGRTVIILAKCFPSIAYQMSRAGISCKGITNVITSELANGTIVEQLFAKMYDDRSAKYIIIEIRER